MKFDILHKKKAQAGYTMFETIGALGLLSLLLMGSIRGIQYSSDRLHANELNNEIMQRAADIKMQLDRPHAKVKWSKWEAKSHTGCPIEFSQNTEEVTIQVLNIKQRVCEMVLTDLSHLEGASRVEGNCSSSADNTLVFYFDKLGAKKRIKKEDCFCDEPKVCDENGDCVCSETSPIGYDPDTCNCPSPLVPIKGKCLCEDETEPIDGVCGDCSLDEDCSGGQTCENHVCTCIAKECSGSDFTDTLCACCPTETPKWDDVEGACKTCADIDINLPVYNKDTKTCEACPDNKIWDSVSGQCVECVVDTDCAASGFVCANNVCACAEGASTPCAASLKQTTNTSKYNQICYICTCPTGSTLSGSTCVCNSECQTYNTSTKTCTNKTNGTTCTNGLCSGGVCKNDTCPNGTSKSCSANLVATASSKTAYGTQCYTCGCPSGSTLSSDGTTCVCNNECQTYNTSTKTCVSKTDGTTCTNGLCSGGVCKNDTCPSGTSKSCSANLVATASSKTAYGTQCYKCSCPSGSTLSSDGTTCVCNNECQTYNTSTKTCVSKTDGTACTNGLCKAGTCTNDTCPSGTSKSCASGMTATLSSTTAYGTACYTCSCPLNYTLTNGTCVANSCSYNTCSGQYYCLTNKVAQGSSCSAPTGGVCTATTYRTVTASGKTYYVSNREFTYWDAVSFCRSLGKTLIAPSDLASDYVSGYENYTVTLKPLATAIKNLGIKDYLWTTQQGSIYGTSCYRVEIGSANAFVYEYNIRANDRQDYAVCK